MSEPLLEISDLTIQYQTDKGMLTAVSDASFTINRGEYFGLVGESGCGKSTIAKAILGGLDSNGEISSGKIRYKGEEIQGLSEEELNKNIRWEEISAIPQSSMNNLDPLERISDQAVAIAEAHDVDSDHALENFRELFEIMGLPEDRIDDYPHQFSGGMQQRAIIALGLFLEPDLVIGDEPTTALDVIMQDQIFKYLDKIKDELDMSMLLITHDISLVFESCERMAIMHGGQVAETGSASQIYHSPHHPYTILLQEAFPDVQHPEQELTEIDGVPPQSMGEVSRCTFAERCPWAGSECVESAPPQEPIKDHESHLAACFRSDEANRDYQQGMHKEMDKNELTLEEKQ